MPNVSPFTFFLFMLHCAQLYEQPVKEQFHGGHSITTWTRKGGRWSKKYLFLSTFKVKNVHVGVGGGQKRAKCPHAQCKFVFLTARMLLFGPRNSFLKWDTFIENN